MRVIDKMLCVAVRKSHQHRFSSVRPGYISPTAHGRKTGAVFVFFDDAESIQGRRPRLRIPLSAMAPIEALS
jgi:hypothetical protein